MAPSDETVSSACRRLVAAGIDLTLLRTIVVDTANRDEGAIRLIALFGALRQGDLTVLFGVSKVTISRLVARLIATEQLRTSTCPDGARGRPATWLLLPEAALPSIVERQAIATRMTDAAIILQAAGQAVQPPKHTAVASAEDTSAAPTASAPPNGGPTDVPIPSGAEAVQLELPELVAPEDRRLDLTLQMGAACQPPPRASAASPRRPTTAGAFEVDSPHVHPAPTSLPTTQMDGNVPAEFPLPEDAAPAPPPSWPAPARPVWLDHDTVPRSLPPWETSTAGTTPRPAPFARQPARGRMPAVPPWQRPWSRTHGYGRGIIRRICAWYRTRRMGNRWTRLGHRVSATGSWPLLHLRCIGRGIGRAPRCIGHAIRRAMSCLGAVIGWISQCIVALHELTGQRIWTAMLMIALLIAGYGMFHLVGSMNLVPSMEVAPLSAPPPTQLPAPTAQFRWARVVGTERVGLLIRNIPNGKRRLGEGLREGATVMVIAGPVTTADAHNPVWWHVRHNGVTGWVSGRFLTFTDQAP